MNLPHDTSFSKNKILFFLFIFPLTLLGSFLLIGTPKAQAATWYVSTTGTDDASHGTGTGANAWLTLNYALTGSRVAKGDTINIEAGTYSTFYGANTYIAPAINTASGSGPVIIQAYPTDAVVTFDMPINTASGMAFIWMQAANWTELTFKHVNFTNSNAVASQSFWIYGHNLTFEDCQITLNAAVSRMPIYISDDTEDANLTFTRTSIINGPAGSNYVIRNINKPGANITVESSTFSGQTAYIFSLAAATNLTVKSSTFSGQTASIFAPSVSSNLTVESSLFYDQTSYIFNLSSATNITLNNNTFFTNREKLYMPAASIGSVYHIHNNIFYANTDFDYRPFVMTDAVVTDLINNPTNWDVTNNIWYWSKAPVAGVIQYQYFMGGITHIDQVDSTNHYINPQFTNTATDDYTIQAGSYICGHGLQASLPADGDVTGAAWTGNDIGAYRCPSASTGVTLLDKVAFVGDSIMLQGTAASTFNTETGVAIVATTDSAITGAGMQKIFDSIDAVMINSSPNTVFLSIGINDLALQSPALATNTEYANYILEMLQKIEDWGATPIWLGIGTLNSYNALPDTPILIINAAVEAGCVSHGWTCDAYYDQMLFNPTWQSASPDGYYVASGNVHPNTAGYELIGRFAEYLYYSNHTMGTNEIDVGAGARVYANGKFRDNNTVSGTTANMTATPVWSSFTTGDYSYWLDIGIDSWLTTGTQNKQWTASSTVATTTIYTIGDLAAEKYYQFKLDGVANTTDISGDTCTNGICLSDTSGNLTFTYSGGYSVHTFALEQNTTAPTNVALTSITADSTSQLTILADTATDADPGLSSTPYWFNETTASSGATDSSAWQASTSFVDSGLAANTQYTYQVKARDGNLNESSYSTALSKYTLAPTPTNLSATAGLTSMTLSATAFNNASSGNSGYYFSSSIGNSGWIQTNSWQETGLNCGTSYTYSVRYRNGDGTETSPTSITKSTIVCGSGGGSHYIPSMGSGTDSYYSLLGQTREIPTLVNNGTNVLTYVNSPLVFSLETSNINYTLEVLSLDTTSGLIKIQLPTGIFYLSPGQNQKFDLDGDGNSDLGLTYNKLSVNQIDLTLAPLNQSSSYIGSLTNGNLVKLPNDPAVYLIENGTKRHIINGETFIAQGFSWSDIKDVSNLDAYPTGQTITLNSNLIDPSNLPDISNDYVFTKNISYGSSDDDILRLQKFLNSHGFIIANSGPGSPKHETKLFGALTKAALIKFQNKYKEQILIPLGLTSGTGYFGYSTREFIKNNF